MGIEELLLDRAEKVGMKKGTAKGMEKGIEQGIEIGMEKGEYRKALEIARKMKRKGVPIVEIAEFTGLSFEEIEKL